ncbi:MAG: DUF72 domain-containing protein [Elusimicrobiota bacterium]
MIKIGCCGYPIARNKYYKHFDCIEINSTFYQLPELKTAEKWRNEAPSNFEFIMKSWQLITHSANSFTYRRLREKIDTSKKKNYGYFKNTKEVFDAWKRTKEFAVKLGCQKIVFQCPASFKPTDENLNCIQGFFKKIHSNREKYNFKFILEVRGENWTEKIVSQLCKKLNLVHCVDPLYAEPVFGMFRYYRLHGLHIGNKLDYNYKYSDKELEEILTLCDEPLNYVMFNNSNMLGDASEFKSLAKNENRID